MAALGATTAFARERRNSQSAQLADYTTGTAAIVYQGALVAINTTTGRAVAATAATGRKILGVALETAQSGATVQVEFGAEYKFDPGTALLASYTGCNVAVVSDNDVSTLSAAGTTAVRVRVGELVQWVSVSECWIAVRRFTESDV